MTEDEKSDRELHEKAVAVAFDLNSYFQENQINVVVAIIAMLMQSCAYVKFGAMTDKEEFIMQCSNVWDATHRDKSKLH